MVSPLTDEQIEILYEDATVDNQNPSIWWPTLDEIDKYWDDGEIIIEPNESHSHTYEFIVGAENKTIMVYAYFYNSKYSNTRNVAEGWEVTTVYDVTNTQGRD